MRPVLVVVLKVLGVGALVALTIAGAFIAAPLPKGLLDYRQVASLRVLDREGGLLREVSSAKDGRCQPLAPHELPPQVVSAFLAAEDHRFFSHPGVSPLAVARAAWTDLRAWRAVTGGSTISMQLARTLVPRERTLVGKVQEALWALRLEAHLEKREVLAQYLNRIPFGNNAWGLEAAAQLYFGRTAATLSLAQAAALAAVPKAPSAFNPQRQTARFAERQRWVLARMAALGAVPKAEVDAALGSPLDVTAFERTFRAPHFVEHLVRHLPEWGLGEAAVVETSLDPRLQRTVEAQIQEELARLEERRVGSAAALVIDNESGEVLAYQGSVDFFSMSAEGQNDGVAMRRQPGSALKPFIYAEALSKRLVTPASVLADVETHFGSPKGGYSPKNYDRQTHGPVRVREALANSYNVPAVKVADLLGLEPSLRVLKRAGFDSLDQGAEHYGLGLALGNGEVSLLELGRAYSGLARGGQVQPLVLVRRAWRADGSEMLVPHAFKPRRFVDARAAALVTDILSDNSARARAFGLDNALRLNFPVAAKTGTSKGYSDNWAVGFTHERTVAVWAGNFDGTPMVQVSGITGAGPIFKRVLSKSMEGLSTRPLVDARGLVSAAVCPLSGELAGSHCPAVMDEKFIAGTAPTKRCPMHDGVSDGLPRELASKCDELSRRQGRVVDLGPDFYEWARAQGLADEPWLSAACHTRGDDTKTAIVFPAPGDEFLVLSDLPLEDQALPVKLRADPSYGKLEVRVDGQMALVLGAPYAGRVPARAGAHRLSVHRLGEEAPLAEVKYLVRSEGHVAR